MSARTFLLLALAGIGAGLTGSIAGIASLISYPALLAAGLPPISANVTNTVAMIFQGVGSIYGSAPELRGGRQRQLIRRLVVWAVLGGVVGGVLLLRTPSGAFQKLVPWLIGGSALAVLLPPRPPRALRSVTRESAPLQIGVFLIGIYGGYFGAAAGVLLLSLLLALTGESLARSSAVRIVLLSCANAVAAVYFAVFADVHWALVLPLALGLLVGGRIGPVLVRRAPAKAIKVLIALAGLALAVHLAIDAY